MNIIVSYVDGEQLTHDTFMKAQSCVAHATSLPSSTYRRRQYYNVLNKILCMLTVLFIICGHCSPAVVWYNYHE